MRSGFAALASLALFASPAGAQESAREDSQRALKDGDPQQAIAILEKALSASPADADLLRRLAVAQAASGDLPLALATIDEALALAPRDNDIRLARARILLWSNQRDAARRQAEMVAAESPAYPELDQVLRSIDNAQAQGGPSRNRQGLGVFAGLSRIKLRSGVADTWESFGIDGFRQFGASTLSVSAIREQRARADTRIAVRLDRRLGGGSAYLEAAWTPSADFREEWGVSAGGAVPLGAKATALLDVRYAQYSDTTVGSIRPALRIAATPGLSLTGQAIVLLQKDTRAKAGASLRADALGPGASSLFLGAASYPDTEAGITREVRALYGGISVPISDRVTLRVSAEHERRSRTYTRDGAVLGLSWRFGG
ncbi:YaiO family outer membrane beta-barrel protein [Novosphingobium aquimarinum]|uniref:YaiO family outer membrane beta-barrel protein n=1 Tax=Novosphingobium aquimarinum TaxID=2682494 RepID=UPI0012EBF2A2|nr:YaiO family outer membrane beta-barrel protein [Novosphingobium aquimarinum]